MEPNNEKDCWCYKEGIKHNNSHIPKMIKVLPPKTNEDWKTQLKERAVWSSQCSNIKVLTLGHAESIMQEALTEKDKEKEEAVAEEIKRIAKILLEDKNKVVQLVGKALLPDQSELDQPTSMATFEIPQHPFEQNELNSLPFCKCGLSKAMHEVTSE